MALRSRKTYRIRTVDNALDILEAISDLKGDVCVSHLSEKLKLNKSSLFRFLTTFEQRGYLEPSVTSNGYRIGVSAVETSRKLLLRMDLLSHAKPIMELLSRESNEDIYLAVPLNNEILLLDAVLSIQKVQIVPFVGKRFPLEKISAGKLLLAYRHEHQASTEYAEIRRQGACIDHELLGEGVSSIAVPLFNAKKEVAGSLCVIGPTYRCTDELIQNELLPRVKMAGQTVSSRLGYLDYFIKE